MKIRRFIKKRRRKASAIQRRVDDRIKQLRRAGFVVIRVDDVPELQRRSPNVGGGTVVG